MADGQRELDEAVKQLQRDVVELQNWNRIFAAEQQIHDLHDQVAMLHDHDLYAESRHEDSASLHEAFASDNSLIGDGDDDDDDEDGDGRGNGRDVGRADGRADGRCGFFGCTLADNHHGEHVFPPLPARRARTTVQEAAAAAARVRAFGMAPPAEHVEAGWAAALDPDDAADAAGADGLDPALDPDAAADADGADDVDQCIYSRLCTLGRHTRTGDNRFCSHNGIPVKEYGRMLRRQQRLQARAGAAEEDGSDPDGCTDTSVVSRLQAAFLGAINRADMAAADMVAVQLQPPTDIGTYDEAAAFLTSRPEKPSDLDSRLSVRNTQLRWGIDAVTSLTALNLGSGMARLTAAIDKDPSCLECNVPDSQRGAHFFQINQAWIRSHQPEYDYLAKKLGARQVGCYHADAARLVCGLVDSPQPRGRYMGPTDIIRLWNQSGGKCRVSGCKSGRDMFLYPPLHEWADDADNAPATRQRATMSHE